MRCARCGVELGRSPGMFCPHCGLPVYLNLSREAEGAALGASTNPENGYGLTNTDQKVAAMGQRSTGSYRVPPDAPASSMSERPEPPFASGWSRSGPYPTEDAFAPEPDTPAYRFDIAPTIPISPPSPPKWGGHLPASASRKLPSGTRTALIVAIVLFVVSGLAVTMYAVYNAAGAGTPHAATTKPTATPNEAVVVQDTLATNTLGWPKTSHCFFQNASFHVKDNRYCYAGKPYTDARITIQSTQIGGPADSPYGIVFRVSSLSDFYGFEVSGNGTWFVWKCAGGKCEKIVPSTQTSALHGDIGETNTLSVLMQASHFEFFINGEKVGTVNDESYTSGNVGLEAGKGVEVTFSNLTIAVPQAAR
jgi:hypothetical protein